MSPRDFHAPVWFVAAVIPMVASQTLRLQQSDPAIWIFWDYAGRLGSLAMLAAIPSIRTVAFRWEKLQIALWEAALWIGGLVLADHYLGGWIRRAINAALPATVLGTYPRLSGWLYFVDVVFGIALVAYNEEIVFRRCARQSATNRAVQAQGCQAEPSAALKWPADEIEARLHLNDTQSAALEVLEDTSASAVEMLNAECRPDAMTPPARLAAVNRRLDAMLQAVKLVGDALEDFYANLSDEQKAQFEAIGPKRTA